MARVVTKDFLADNEEQLEKVAFRFHPLFRGIGRFRDELTDLKNELKVRKRSGGLSYEATLWLVRIVNKLEETAHHTRDIVSFGSTIFHRKTLSVETKRDLDEKILSLAAKLKDIVIAVEDPRRCSLPEWNSEASEGIRDYGLVASEDKDEIQLVSLQLSLRHLKSEIWELADFIKIFLIEIEMVSSRRKRG